MTTRKWNRGLEREVDCPSGVCRYCYLIGDESADDEVTMYSYIDKRGHLKCVLDRSMSRTMEVALRHQGGTMMRQA